MSAHEIGQFLGNLIVTLIIASPWLYVGYEIFLKPVRKHG